MGLRVAVVGHVEWTTIVKAGRFPGVGEICATEAVWEGPAGGGAVAAVRMAALVGECTFFTRLGSDDPGEQSRRRLAALGVRVHAAPAGGPTSRAMSVLDPSGERTTFTVGTRSQPYGSDPLPWPELAGYDAVYFTAGDVAALRTARRARVLVATLRELSTVVAAGVPMDGLIGSGCDPAEVYRPLDETPGLLVRTAGDRGGEFVTAAGVRGRYPACAPPAGPVDTYGIGDNFAASLTVALAICRDPSTALRAAAVDGASCVATRGPYRQVLVG
jgi:ribokinase